MYNISPFFGVINYVQKNSPNTLKLISLGQILCGVKSQMLMLLSRKS